MSREAMKLALDMLNEIADDVYCDQKLEGVITALRQALETEQEPVAWLSEGGDVSRSKRYMDEMGFKCNAVHPEYASDITKVAAQAIRARGNK